jgi:adenine-specific DNA-methyltransferase
MSVETIIHEEASRKNIPTAEYQSIMDTDQLSPVRVAYERRNRDLDPQLVWRGKDEQDWSDLVVQAPPLYIQEKVHPKVLIDDLLRRSNLDEKKNESQIDLFGDFNGLPNEMAKTEFYQHDANWANRMILGDSLQVMASLAEREGLRGKVQCIYLDPPYGIKFNSNFQWSTKSRDAKDGNVEHITREPEQVKAFRDTWRDGIHSYLTYLRDRLTVARDLLTDSGSIFVQIGDENVHRVRALMDEVFGGENFITQIDYRTSIGLGSAYLDSVANYIVWYSTNKEITKFRGLIHKLVRGEAGATRYNHITENGIDRPLGSEEKDIKHSSIDESKCFFRQGLTSRSGSDSTAFGIDFKGCRYFPSAGGWRTGEKGVRLLTRANRIAIEGKRLTFKKFFGDFGAMALTNFWDDVTGGISSRSDPKVYVVQTATEIVKRCILMTTDPGDLVVDPTCGSGTTSYVAEQWGRRWITIDTSRVALALARARLMGARYSY